MDKIFIFGAKDLIIAPVIAILWLIARSPKDKWLTMTAQLAWVGVVAFVIAKIGAHFYYDPRPFVTGNFTPLIPHAADNGFPSDHTLLATVIAVVGYYWDKRVGRNLAIVAAVIAVSRVYVGVHHIIDVVASIVIALVAGLVVHYTKQIKSN